jgi:hypothetical protein
MSWARLLKRVFDIDIERCPECGGKLKIIAAIEEPAVTSSCAGTWGCACSRRHARQRDASNCFKQLDSECRRVLAESAGWARLRACASV